METETRSNQKKPFNRQIISLIFLVAIITTMLYQCTRYEANDDEALKMAEYFVSQKLLAPRSADFCPKEVAVIKNFEKNKWSVGSCVDSENAYGTMVRTQYYAEVEYIGDETWELTFFEEVFK